MSCVLSLLCSAVRCRAATLPAVSCRAAEMAAFHRQRMLHKTPQALVRQRRTPGSFQKTPGTTPSGYDMDDSFMTQSARLAHP